MRETRGQKVFKVFNYTFLSLLGLATFYPSWYVLIAGRRMAYPAGFHPGELFEGASG